jgi:hypothetical protein
MPRRCLFALLLALAACASSRPSGDMIDSAGGDDDGSDADPGNDGNVETDAPDLPIDGADIDSSTPPIDAAIDASMPIDAPIDASTCPTAPCDLHAQCGCTSPLVCDIDFTDLMGNSCRAVNQAGTETSHCAQGAVPQSSYCAGGYVCVGTGADARCEKYCDASSDCGQPRGQCVIQLMNGAMPIAGATTCSSNCNPLNSAAGGCPAGDKCGFFTVNNALTGNVDRDIVDCTTPGAGGHGTTCTNDSTCASDTLCTTVSAQTRCRRVCNRTTGGNECAGLAGTTCIGFNPALTIGGTEYGVCAP